jgi:general secretion pathway protein K
VIRSRSSQRGAALILALVVLAVLGAAVLDNALGARRLWRTARNYRAHIQARLAARSTLHAAVEVLRRDDPRIDWLGEEWARPLRLPVPGVELLEVALTDEESRFDLDALLLPGGEPDPRRMEQLRALLGDTRFRRLTPPLLDWIDGDEETRPGGAERPDYGGRLPPFLPRNGPLATMAELPLIRNWQSLAGEPKLLESFTIHSGGLINVNTARPELLRSLLKEYNRESSIEDFLSRRRSEPCTSLEDLFDRLRLGAAERRALRPLLTVRSRTFRLDTRVTVDGLTLQAGAIIRRSVEMLRVVEWREE